MRIIALAALVVIASLPARAAEDEPLLSARVVSARPAGMTAGDVAFDVVVGLTASRAVTLRRLVFTESYAGEIPVAIDDLSGRWRLEAGVEHVLDPPLRVTVHVADSARLREVGALLAGDSVPVRSVVEATLDAPLLARVLLRKRSRTLFSATTLDVPVAAAGPAAGLFRLGAGAAGFAAALALPFLERLQAPVAERRQALDRLRTSAAVVTTTYAIAGGEGAPVRKEKQFTGFWWTEDTLCTVREALEPWRFDMADGLRLRSGRLDGESVAHELTTPGGRIVIDSPALMAGLPAVRNRSIDVVDGDELRRVRLLDREEASNIACLRGIRGQPVVRAGPAVDGVRAAAGHPTGAVFDLVWTTLAAADRDRLALRVPVPPQSFGSPVFAGEGAIAMILSPRRAVTLPEVERAAAAAVPAPVRRQLAGSMRISAPSGLPFP